MINSFTLRTGRTPNTGREPVTCTRLTLPRKAISRPVARYGITIRSGGAFRRRPLPTGLVYMPDFSGFLHCLDARTGEVYWVHDLLAAVWGSALVVDGKVYLGDEDGDVVILKAGKEEKVLAEMYMGSSVYSTPVPANGVLYIMNRSEIYALANTAPRTGH